MKKHNSANKQRKLVLTPDSHKYRPRKASFSLLQCNAVVHGGDIVEEIATHRQGEIDAIDQYISEGQSLPPRWRGALLFTVNHIIELLEF